MSDSKFAMPTGSVMDVQKLLAEYMSINNELSDLQRELAIKNNQLKAQEKRFRDLVTFAPGALVVLSPQGELLFANPVAERHFSGNWGESVALLSVLKPGAYEELLFHVSGLKIYMEVRCVELVWEGTSAHLFLLQDISERKHIEHVKEDVQRITQHDLISPLSPIINIPGVLLEDGNLTSSQRQLLTRIVCAGNRLQDMIRLSLNMYKMELGTYSYDTERVDLLRVLMDIRSDQTVKLRNCTVDIVLSGENYGPEDSRTFFVAGNYTLYYSLFSNLFVNAIEASSENGVITITFEESEHAVVRIHNIGVVPQEIRSRFFDKYVTSGKKLGTGLGTYSAKLITTTMGGKISMESSEDKGTIIQVILPWATMDSNAQESTDLAEATALDESQWKYSEEVVGKIQVCLERLRREVTFHAFMAFKTANEILGFLEPGSEYAALTNQIAGHLGVFDFERAEAILPSLGNRLSELWGRDDA